MKKEKVKKSITELIKNNGGRVQKINVFLKCHRRE